MHLKISNIIFHSEAEGRAALIDQPDNHFVIWNSTKEPGAMRLVLKRQGKMVEYGPMYAKQSRTGQVDFHQGLIDLSEKPSSGTRKRADQDTAVTSYDGLMCEKHLGLLITKFVECFNNTHRQSPVGIWTCVTSIVGTSSVVLSSFSPPTKPLAGVFVASRKMHSARRVHYT